MNTISLSPTTITTLIGIFLAVLLITLCRRTISSFFLSIVAVIVLILAFEAVTGHKLLDFGELVSFLINILLRFLYWIESSLLPGMSDAVKDIVSSFNP